MSISQKQLLGMMTGRAGRCGQGENRWWRTVEFMFNVWLAAVLVICALIALCG